jgi:O-antigen ligase
LNTLAWSPDSPWNSRAVTLSTTAALALAATAVWFLPPVLSLVTWALVGLALFLLVALLWREGYTWAVLWLAPIAAFDPLPTDGIRLAKYVLLAAVLALAIAKRRLYPRAPARLDMRPLWAALALLSWLFIRAITGANPVMGLAETGRLALVGALIYMWSTESVRPGGRRRWFAIWMTMGMYQVVVCLVEATAYGALRSYGTFPNANAMGTYLFLTVALAFGVAIHATTRRGRIGNWILVLLLIFSLYLTGARAAWLATAIALLVMAAVARRGKILTLGFAILGIVGVFYLTNPLFRFATDAALRLQTGLTHRPILWEAADRALSRVPLWGFGVEAAGMEMAREARYPSDVHRSIVAPMMNVGSPHNFYRELELETGLIGMTLFVLVVMAILAAAKRGFRSRDPWRRSYALALLGVMLGLLAHAYFERSVFLGAMSSSVFFWFLVVHTARQDEPVAVAQA